ncbi:sigma factor-like helix-turn-helix DNA-binding protein [Escherichia coli]|nr:sigma factor-like helix-turn-helix DNA-binding protein [Escherichia coli]
MLDIILATRDIYFEKALREVFGTVSSRIRYIEDAISDRRRVQSGRSFRYYFVFCDDEYTDIVRILFTGEACCILNKSMLNLRAAGGVLTLEERRAVLNRYYRGLSIAEITEETGQNDKTVYGHLRRALQRSGFRKGRFIKGREAAGIQVLNNVSYIVISVLLLLFFCCICDEWLRIKHELVIIRTGCLYMKITKAAFIFALSVWSVAVICLLLFVLIVLG